jgi:hypothetical protein
MAAKSYVQTAVTARRKEEPDMLRMPVIGRTSGRQISLGGSGDTKDKLLVGGLAVVIVGAIVGLVYSIVSKPTVGSEIPTSFHLGCFACNNEWEITKDEYYQHMREMGERAVSMTPRFVCPKCKDPRQTGFVMSQCPYPACQKWYFSNTILKLVGKPTTEPPKCPYCGGDIMQGLRQYRSGKK